MGRYTTYVLDLAKVCCLFELQLMRLEPRKHKKLLVDLISSRHPNKYASEYVCNDMDNFFFVS